MTLVVRSLARPSMLFYRHDGILFGPLVITNEIRVGPACFPLTNAGLRSAVDMAPEVDIGDQWYKGLLVCPECGRVDGLPGVLVHDTRIPEEVLCVTLEGRIVALCEPRSMTWNGAVLALIRDGHINVTPTQEELLRTGVPLWTHPAWFRCRPATTSDVLQWLSDGKPILRATRAKPGEGKTSPFRRDTIRAVATELGYTDITIPENSIEARRLENALLDERRKRREEGTLAPTARQLALAEDLALRCNVIVPDATRASAKECSAFIDLYLELAPPSERQLKYARRLSGGVPLPDAAFKSAKACGEWITKMEGKARR